MNILVTTLPLINIFGFLILGAAMIFTQWRLGGNRVSIDVISAYKDRVEQLIAENGTLRASQVEQGKQITVLQTESITKDKRISELTLIISGKDPAQVEYMSRMESLAKSVTEFMERSDDREGKMLEAMRNLNR